MTDDFTLVSTEKRFHARRVAKGSLKANIVLNHLFAASALFVRKDLARWARPFMALRDAAMTTL